MSEINEIIVNEQSYDVHDKRTHILNSTTDDFKGSAQIAIAELQEIHNNFASYTDTFFYIRNASTQQLVPLYITYYGSSLEGFFETDKRYEFILMGNTLICKGWCIHFLNSTADDIITKKASAIGEMITLRHEYGDGSSTVFYTADNLPFIVEIWGETFQAHLIYDRSLYYVYIDADDSECNVEQYELWHISAIEEVTANAINELAEKAGILDENGKIGYNTSINANYIQNALSLHDAALILDSCLKSTNDRLLTENEALTKRLARLELLTNGDVVDLGLPSGKLWAKYNLGAEKETDFGKYYQWGATVGYKDNQARAHSTWSTAPFNNGSSNYYESYFKANKNRWISSDGTLTLDYDAAWQETSGRMRMPTAEEFNELLDNTEVVFVTNFNDTGVSGAKIMNRKDTSKYIFIPQAGYYYNGEYTNTATDLWTSSLVPDDHPVGDYSDAFNVYGTPYSPMGTGEPVSRFEAAGIRPIFVG